MLNESQKTILKKKQQILNDAKCIAARFIHEALMVAYLELIKQRCFTWLH